MPHTIVLIEDDPSIQEMLRYYFKSVGYEAEIYSSGEEYFSAPAECPSIFLLDIMLPGMDGLEILRRLRRNSETARLPILMLTAKGAEMDKVTGLDLGADDYLAKPFGILELQARIRALLRRAPEPEPAERFRCGGVELDVRGHTVTLDGQPVELTRKEFDLLHLLLRRKGMVLTRDEILQQVWGYDYSGETRTVDMHVKDLRQKLGEELILTVRGVGYKIP